MGFYGHIVDRANEILKFERIFASRYDMDLSAAAGTDNVFPGHFVLVQYDPSGKLYAGDFYCAYRNEETGLFYADAALTLPLKYTVFSKVGSPNAQNWEQYWERYDENIYLKVPNADYYNANQANYYISSAQNDEVAWLNMIVRLRSYSGKPLESYYKCIGQDSSGNATWQPIYEDDVMYGDYFKNYFIDRSNYSLERNILGYDSTVWEKVYEDGVGKFIFIAHLNGMMPGIKLYDEPPSLYPSAPYLDAKSTDALYRIHVPTHWGFSFKEDNPIEQGGLSEQVITVDKRLYATDGSNTYRVEPTEINADIYLNKQGADKDFRYRDEDTDNEIRLEPTGISGKIYEGGHTLPDTMELSIHLPLLGNAVSDVYDILYGYDDTLTTSPQPRYTDVDWISGQHSSTEKYYGFSEKKTHDLNTIAGSLNTIHDRLGQIIVPLERWVNPADEEYDTWIAGLNGTECIYSYQTTPTNPPTYYRIAEDATYQDPENGTFKYVPIDFTNNTAAYEPNTFYYLDQPFNNDVNAVLYESQSSHQATIANLLIDTNGSYTPRPNRYYYKKSIAEIAYTGIELEFYQPNKYFLKQDTSYLRDHGINGAGASTNAPTNPYAQYYYIDENSANLHGYRFTNGYTPRSYFYYQEPGKTNYRWAIEDYPNGAIQYYTTVQQQVFEQQEVILYKKNLLYYSVGNNSQQYYAMEDDTYQEFRNNHRLIVADETFKVYWLEFEETPIITLAVINGIQQTVLSYPVKPGGAHEITAPIVDMFSASALQAEYTSFLSDHPGMEATYKTLFFKDENNNYISYENLADIPPLANGTPYYATPRAYYMVAISPQLLYIPGRYYVREPDNTTGDYHISWEEWNPITGRNTTYYIIDEIISITKPFYMPNTYYYKDNINADYSTITDQTAAYYQNHTYHRYYATKQKLYVESDSSGRCPAGYEWNEESMFIPASIVLKQLSKRLVLTEMEGFDNGISSINGTLLRMSQEYCPESKTRDATTFRGGLNKLSDLLYTIDKLTPGKVVYVNDFGQLTTGDLSYAQLAALVT